MSILKALGLGRPQQNEESSADTETVRRIVAELEALEPERARYVAAFAYILGRVANADQNISEVETREMESVVRGLGHLPEHQAVLVVQMAKSQNRLFGHTENFLVTREFHDISSEAERVELLDCLFAVSVADESISGAEEAQIRQISSELGFSHRDYVEARAKYSDKREVMKGLRKKSEEG